MVQSPSWEANWFAASQEITRISRNPKVHYRTNKHPPPVSILGQLNPVHIPTSHLLEIHPSTHLRLGLPSGLFPSGFPSKTLYIPSPHPYAPHAQPISFFSILSPAQYRVRSTNIYMNIYNTKLCNIQMWFLSSPKILDHHFCFKNIYICLIELVKIYVFSEVIWKARTEFGCVKLFCAVLCCAVLCCVVLCCFVLCCVVLCCVPPRLSNHF